MTDYLFFWHYDPHALDVFSRVHAYYAIERDLAISVPLWACDGLLKTNKGAAVCAAGIALTHKGVGRYPARKFTVMTKNTEEAIGAEAFISRFSEVGHE